MTKRDVVERLYNILMNNHELRLGQLIWNNFSDADFFYVSDEDFLRKLENKE